VRKQLIYTIYFFIAVSVVAIFYVFRQSLGVSDKVMGERPVYDLSQIKVGEYRLVDLPNSRLGNRKIMVIKNWDSKIYVYILPTKDGKIVMPDTPNGWWGYYECSDFSPEMDKNNKIVRGGHIVCHDKNAMAYNHVDWVWSINGKALGYKMPPMDIPKTEQVGNKIYLNF